MLPCGFLFSCLFVFDFEIKGKKSLVSIILFAFFGLRETQVEIGQTFEAQWEKTLFISNTG